MGLADFFLAPMLVVFGIGVGIIGIGVVVFVLYVLFDWFFDWAMREPEKDESN